MLERELARGRLNENMVRVVLGRHVSVFDVHGIYRLGVHSGMPNGLERVPGIMPVPWLTAATPRNSWPRARKGACARTEGVPASARGGPRPRRCSVRPRRRRRPPPRPSGAATRRACERPRCYAERGADGASASNRPTHPTEPLIPHARNATATAKLCFGISASMASDKRCGRGLQLALRQRMCLS